MSPDPYGTRALRDAVLAAWAASPARLREDANAEEDHARGWYRDRVVVELAQNAADAALRAGAPGALTLELRTDGPRALLVATNTGAPLDAAGVAALASLRASAKRDRTDAVGRFGVGFAAVRSVADEAAVLTAAGAVHFSLAATRAALADAPPAVADEVARRGAWLPVLRLPFEGAGHLDVAPPEAGTRVVLHLRDAAAVAGVRAQLDAVDDALLLALPGLARVEVRTPDGVRTLADVEDRWWVARRSGTLPAALLAGRPVEEQGRTAWQVAWAVPREGAVPYDGAVPRVVHAPTPTDEPCSVPALLVASFPLDPSRRHVAPGPVKDLLVAEAGRAWSDLLVTLRRGERDDDAPHALDLLPSALAAGTLDAALGAAVRAAVRDAPVLTPAGGGAQVAPSAAVVLAGPAEVRALVTLLGEHVPALVHLDATRRRAAVALGATEVDLAELVDALPGDAVTSARLLEAAGTDPHVLERLATLAVPLADGRVVRGARGLLVPRDVPPAVLPTLARWGVRLVHPDVVHPSLERLGARVVGAADLLREPAVRERVLDEDDDAPEVLLTLAGADQGRTDAEPWWGDVLLPASDGEPTPARDLVLPGSDAQRWFDDARIWSVDPALADRARDAVVRLGVRAGLVTGRRALDEDHDDPLDGWEEYVDHLEDLLDADAAAIDVPPVPVLADLELVRPGAWREVLAAVARGPARAALEPVRAGVAGRDVVLPGYAAWWFRERSGLGLPAAFALTDAGPVVRGLLGPVPDVLSGLDEQVLRALGGVRDLGELDLDAWHAVLVDLAARRPGAPVEAAVAVEVWRALRADPDRAPDVVPALTREGVRTVPLDDVAVADPMWAQLADVRPCVVAPAAEVTALADALGVDPAPARAAGRITSSGARAVLPGPVTATWAGTPGTYVEHDRLEVDGHEVTWWVVDGVPHAATVRGLASALASLVGWAERDALARVLAGEAVDDVVLEQAGGAQRA